MKLPLPLFFTLSKTAYSFSSNHARLTTPIRSSTTLQMSTTWSDLKKASLETPVGSALEQDAQLRATGRGEAHVDNKLRLFDKPDSFTPKLTLYRDKAGWCPYCEKTILLVEEKRIPIKIETVNMRSYGDKPTEFLRMVPNGLLPALIIEGTEGTQPRVVTESQVIMEILDGMHPPTDGYKAMLPNQDDKAGWERTQSLARLERELFGVWCNLIFRPEGGPSFGGMFDTIKSKVTNTESEMSPQMRAFMAVLDKVDSELMQTGGPWFFESEHPMMIDLIFVSHVERMLASCAYWKGLQIRGSGQWKGIDAWFDAFDLRPAYLGFKSDFYTNVMDIPPQYGPGFDGGFEQARAEFASSIGGKDGKSWSLPLEHDVPLEPLYKGPPLAPSALEAAGISDYVNADPSQMQKACRHAAGWKLASNGIHVSRFAARAGAKGSQNNRKTFAAPLADPYADPDEAARPVVDATLRIVCEALLENGPNRESVLTELERQLAGAVPRDLKMDVVNSLIYVRDRVGVPRDMPLAAARQFRSHLNWAVDAVQK